MITLDGSSGEGGGQILRTALALATLTGASFHITNIRANRPQPGLKAQHLHAIKAYKKLTTGKSSPAIIGAQELRFVPGKILGGTLTLDVGTAGNLPLLIQSILPVLVKAPKRSRLTLTGGTDTAWAPSWDLLCATLFPHLTPLATIKATLHRRGYYPKGNGAVTLTVHPTRTPQQPYALTTAKPVAISGIIHLHRSLAPKQIGERIQTAIMSTLQTIDLPKNIQVTYVDTPSIGGGVSLWTRGTLLGADYLIQQGVSAEAIGTTCANTLRKALSNNWCVDSHLQDQLIPYLALLGGSMFGPKPSAHTLTNISTCKAFLNTSFTLEDHDNGTFISAKAI